MEKRCLGKRIIIINGCFSVGKSTFARELARLFTLCSAIDLDIFASFHPENMTGRNFSQGNLVWNNIISVVKNCLRAGVTCIISTAAIDGMTSTSLSRLIDRLGIIDNVYLINLSAPFDRIKEQNSKRKDIKYPDCLIEKCWHAANKIVDSYGYHYDIGKKGTKRVVADLKNLILKGKGKLS